MDPDLRAKIARGMKAATIDATVLRELLIEAHEEARVKYETDAPSTFYVSESMAILKLTDRTRSVKYHRSACRHFGVAEEDRMKVDDQQIPVRGYEPCIYCNQLSLTEWSHMIGVDPSTVTAIIRKDKLRVRKRNAVKLFLAIGEQPHPSLLEYAS